MEADDERIRSDSPRAGLVFRHGMTPAEIEFNLPGLRRRDAKPRAAIGGDLWVLGARNVGGRRFETRVAGGLAEYKAGRRKQ
jgi:hypothetical protein